MSTAPNLTPVESSQIAAIGHDGETNTLFVQFKRGGQPDATYKYAGVTPEDFQAFQSAKSIGSHFHNNIRAKFEFEKLPAPKDDDKQAADASS